MSTISILKDCVIDKIAAGEVIQEPFSVVKELVENSLDALATKIKIEIKAGGLLSIKVEDNGIGMSKEDLTKCVQRHATSKLKEVKDLESIDTMGFRGEALASIGSISKLKIDSKKDSGYFIEVEGGKVLTVERSQRIVGTLVEVKNLFYNVPARRKFQKAISVLSSNITKLVLQLALANEKVSFLLVSNEKVVLDLKAGSLEKRMEDIFSKDIFKNLKKVEYNKGSFSLFGYVGSPFFTKKNRASQYLIINKRVVFNSIVSSAIKEGYGFSIEKDDYPFFVLHMDIKKDEIDVNVDPQKNKIRIRDSFFIKEKIAAAIEKSLEEKKDISFEKELSFYEETPKKNQTQEVFDSFRQTSFFEVHNFENDLRPLFLLDNFLFLEDSSIFEQGKKETVLLDLDSAVVSLFFDEFTKNKTEIQKLIEPIVIDLFKDKMLFVENNLLLFKNIGFDVRVISSNTIAIFSSIGFLSIEETKKLFDIVLEDLFVFGKTDIKKEIDKKTLTKAASFIKNRHKKFSMQEGVEIFKKLKKCKNIYIDPLGGATLVLVTKDLLKKIFKKRG